MITMKEARTEMASLSPALQRAEETYTAEWGEEELSTTVMEGFAHAFAHEFATLTEKVLRQIFDTIEKLMVLGDDTVQTAVATGFLEALLNSVLRKKVERNVIESLLGPESLKYFQEWDHFSYNMDANPLPTLAQGYSSEAEYARARIQIIERWLQENPIAPPADRAIAEHMLLELRQEIIKAEK